MIKKYESKIKSWDFDKVIRVLQIWCNKFCKAEFEIEYFTRTSTKQINLFIENQYPERIDGYMLTGLIIRMSEMNIRLENIEKIERWFSGKNRILNCFLLRFEGSSLGRGFNSVYTIQNNLRGRVNFPPEITS